MSVKWYLALLVGVFVAALAVVTVTQRATAGASPPILVPVLVTLGAVALAILLVRLVLRDIARPFHSAGVNIRSNVDQLSAVVQQLAATTAEQSSGVAETSATMEELGPGGRIDRRDGRPGRHPGRHHPQQPGAGPVRHPDLGRADPDPGRPGGRGRGHHRPDQRDR